MISTQRRVPAITGVGLVTGFGPSARETWSAVRQGHSAVQTLELDGLRVLAAPASRFDAPSTEANVSLALHAAREAVTDAGIRPEELAGPHTACTISSSKGGMKSLFRLHGEFL